MAKSADMGVYKYKAVIEPCRKPGVNTLKFVTENRTTYVHSKYDPVSESEKQLDKLPIGVDTRYIIFGLGLGYHVRALLNKLGKDNKIIVFEPNFEVADLFITNRENRDILEDERVTIMKYLNVHRASIAIDAYYDTPLAFKNNMVFIHPVYKEVYADECVEFTSLIKSLVLKCKISYNTVSLFTDIWFKCLINNVSFLRKSYSAAKLAGRFKDVPAVIVSAGPSLAKNAELIKQIYEKALIIAVDTAYKPLYSRCIEPTFTVTVDAQPVVLRKFSDTDILEKDLVTTYMSSAEVQKRHVGRKIAFSTEDVYLDYEFEKLGIKTLEILTGGSVACTAIDFAYKTGANPIILIGQDLAYTGAKSHIEGAAFYKTFHTDAETFTVPDINGEPVMTTYNLDFYRKWIEAFIDFNNDRIYIDATEGGARIDGTLIKPFREAIDEYCVKERAITAAKEEVFTQDNKTATKSQYEAFLDNMESAYKYLRKIIPDIDECIPLCERIMKEVKLHGFSRPERIAKPYEKIKRLNATLDKNEHYVDIILYLMSMHREAASQTDHLLNSHLSDEEALVLDLEKFMDYYKALSEKASYAVPLIEKAVVCERDNREDWGYE